jgi:hypothetical protein
MWARVDVFDLRSRLPTATSQIARDVVRRVGRSRTPLAEAPEFRIDDDAAQGLDLLAITSRPSQLRP